MRSLRTKATTCLLAGAMLLLTACGGDDGAANNVAANEVDSNIMFEDIGNDASALEAAGNANPLPSADMAANTSEPAGNGSDGSDAPVFGETSGGDTGGNVAGNVSGM
jgi:hypothetical protein